MAEVGPSSHDSLIPRLTDGAHVLTVAFAVLYVIGFVVANAYLGRYEIVRFDLFRGRYVSAGLLCTSVAVIGAAIGWRVGVNYRYSDGRGKSKKARQAGSLVALIFVAGLLTLLMRALFIPITVGHMPLTGLFAFFFAVTCVGATIGSAAHKFANSRGSLSGRGVTPIRAMGVGLTSVAMAFVFGQFAYPYILPAFGGGAAALAMVGVDSTALSPALRESIGRPVALVDRDELEVDLVTCLNVASRNAESVSIPASAVRWISLRGFVPARDAASILCTQPLGGDAHGATR